MKIAVTGGSGNIGSALIRHLLERGHQPINLDVRQADQVMAPFVYCEASRRELLQPALAGVDAVVHLGEFPGHTLPMAPNEIFSRNTAAGSCVFQTAADLGIKRVVYASTAQIYGVTGMPKGAPSSLPFDETHPIQPNNVYALSKAANETYARLVAQHYPAMSIAAFRLPKVIFPWHEEHHIPWQLRENEPIRELGLYVGWTDVMRAFELALLHGRAGFEAYNLSAADVICLTPIRDRLIADHPSYPHLPADWPATASPMLARKVREHLGWEPTFSAMENHHRNRRRKEEAA